MSKQVNLDDEVIEKLDRIRTEKRWSYSQAIKWIIERADRRTKER